jgi:hypothetical protein
MYTVTFLSSLFLTDGICILLLYQTKLLIYLVWSCKESDRRPQIRTKNNRIVTTSEENPGILQETRIKDITHAMQEID